MRSGVHARWCAATGALRRARAHRVSRALRERRLGSVEGDSRSWMRGEQQREWRWQTEVDEPTSDLNGDDAAKRVSKEGEWHTGVERGPQCIHHIIDQLTQVGCLRLGEALATAGGLKGPELIRGWQLPLAVGRCRSSRVRERDEPQLRIFVRSEADHFVVSSRATRQLVTSRALRGKSEDDAHESAQRNALKVGAGEEHPLDLWSAGG